MQGGRYTKILRRETRPCQGTGGAQAPESEAGNGRLHHGLNYSTACEGLADSVLATVATGKGGKPK